MTIPTPLRPLLLLLALAAGCGGEIASSSPEELSDVRSIESLPLQWWNAPYTYQSMSYGWHDTDLAVSSSTAIQLRHASKLIAWGVYGWGYMPTFVDEHTGATFRFLHLRPQHLYATRVGTVYPQGYIVGLSGGDTYDTGLGRYSTGAHLCVQTPGNEPFRSAFPYGSEGGAQGGTPGGSANCNSATLNRTVGAGTCVESASDGNWYTCENGSWVGGQHGCTVAYAWCHSATLNRTVPPRTCVQSKFDRVWYQCNNDGWATPVSGGRGPNGFCSAEYGL